MFWKKKIKSPDVSVIKLPNGSIYEGETTSSGTIHGKGKMTLSNGDVYEGRFYSGKYYGEGKLSRANGDIYEGEFLSGKYHGKGKMTYADGRVENGYWLAGNFLGEDAVGKAKYDKAVDDEDEDIRALQMRN